MRVRSLGVKGEGTSPDTSPKALGVAFSGQGGAPEERAPEERAPEKQRNLATESEANFLVDGYNTDFAAAARGDTATRKSNKTAFDMLRRLQTRRGTPEPMVTISPANLTESDYANANKGAIAVSPEHRAEFLESVRRNIGRRIVREYPMENGSEECRRYYGQIFSIFATKWGKRGGPAFVIGFTARFKEDDLYTEEIVAIGTPGLQRNVFDAPPGPAPDRGYDIVERRALEIFDFDRDITQRWESGPMFVRLFNPFEDGLPFFYGVLRVKPVNAYRIKVDLGPNYEAIHGNRFRTFKSAEYPKVMTNAQMRAVLDADPTDQLAWGWNQLCTWALLDKGKKSLAARGWVTSVDTLEERYRLHEEVLDRMVNPLRQPFANDRDVTLIEAVERIRSAVAKASDVIPISVQKALGKFSMVEENSDSEEESSDADEDAVNFAGFPHGMYYTWSKMRAPTKPRIKWSKIWNKPMLLGKFGPGGDFTGTEFGFPEPESFKNATSSLFDRNSWRPDDDSMSTIFASSLLVSAQLSSLYSHIGTRGHLRLAVKSVCSGTKQKETGSLLLDLYDTNTMFFAPAETARDVFSKTTSPGVQPTFSVRQTAFDFCFSKDVFLSLDQYCEAAENHLLGETTNSIVGKAIGTLTNSAPLRSTLCAVELPVFNPFMLVGDPKKRRCQFVQTQADFVCQVGDMQGTCRGHAVPFNPLQGTCCPL